MYYNLSEEQKIFLAHSYAMLKAGYTHDEIVEYWTCNDQEKVQNIVEDLEYIPVDLKDEDLLNFLDEAWQYIDDVLRIGSQGLKLGRSAMRQIPRAARATQGVINRTDDTVRGVVRALRGGTGTDRMNYLMKNVNKIDDVQRRELKTLMVKNKTDALKFTPAQYDAVRGPGSHTRAQQRYAKNNLDNRLDQTSGLKDPTDPGNFIVKPSGGGPGSGSQAARDQKLIDAIKANTSTPQIPGVPAVPKGSGIPKGTAITAAGGVTGLGIAIGGTALKDAQKDNQGNGSGNGSGKGEKTGDEEPKIPRTIEDKSSRCAKSFGKGSTWDTKKNNGRGGCTAPTKEAYEFILDKLISEGHASSLTEAEYVFKQLDDEYIESMLSEQNLSYSAAKQILTGHQYSRRQLLDMSRKATETGQHGLAQACYDAACKMKI